MNWLDLMILLIIGWSAWRGLETGLVAGLARLCGLFLGLAAALQYHTPLAFYLKEQLPLEQWIGSWLTAPTAGVITKTVSPVAGFEQWLVQGLLPLLAFMTILILVAQIIIWAGRIVARAARLSFLGPLDRVGGLILGTVRGLVLVLVLIAIIVPIQGPGRAILYPGQSWLVQAVEGSRLARPLAGLVGALNLSFPDILPLG